MKNDERDAEDLVDLLRIGRLAEAWIAPPGLRELRELVRHRAKLVALRSGLKAQVHAVLAKEGVAVPAPRACSPPAGGPCWPRWPWATPTVSGSTPCFALVEVLDAEVARFEALVADVLAGHPGYAAVQAIPGVGPVLAAVFVAEIGDVSRFASAARLCSWAGLTPRHRESDTTVHRGHISKQGSRLVRWAAVEAVGRRARRRAWWQRMAVVSRSGEATPSAGWPPPANFSLSSTTACATDTSVAWPRRDERPGAASTRARGLS